jgi:Tfp pilus assembly protein PilN
MRPVNLIPPEQRRGSGSPARAGALSYVVVGVLVVALAAVTATVLFGKRVDDRKSEVASLEATAAETQARADSLSTYTTFQQIHDARVQTVTQLATSRFDWKRVLEELSRVMPPHIWLTSLTGTVSPEVQIGEGGDDGGLRESIEGPALVVVGCGRNHDDVARLVAAMRDIDGVTRVTANDSAKGDSEAGSGGSGADSCQTKPSIPQFHLVAAFDGVTVGASAPPPAESSTTSTTTDTTTADTTTGGSDGGVGGAETQNRVSQAEVNKADAKTDQATDLLPSGGG